MGFESSINFRLSGDGPGELHIGDIARLARLVAELGLTRSKSSPDTPRELVKLWHGARYDSDIEPHMEAYNPDPRFDRMWSYRDRLQVSLEFNALDAAEIADRLAGSTETLYRAYIGLGTLNADLARRLTIPSEANERYFCPGHLSFNIDPWMVVNQRGDDKVVLGFLDLSISGHGYFFPQTAKTYIDILTGYPGIAELTDFIRFLWPQEPDEAPEELIEVRRDWMKTNWIDPIDAPLGWNWMGHESL